MSFASFTTVLSVHACARALVPALVFFVFSPAADAQRRSPGQRVYQTALRFARDRGLPHFTQNTRRGPRLIVNITNSHADAWAETFSPSATDAAPGEDGGGYVEPFFTASATSEPSWSRLRIGKRAFMKYGEGDDFDSQTGSTRLSFPLWLSPAEHAEFVQTIHGSQNFPFDYYGGILSGKEAQNCTDWLTSKIGPYTGITTVSVKHHLRSLVEGPFSERMSVVGVASAEPVANFGPETLRLEWTN